MSPYIRALRPRQWTKNLVVFAAPLFGLGFDLQSYVNSLVAFVLFCCISSSFYLANDIIDVESDRLHPTKCKRPIAANLVSIPSATILSTSLLIIAIVLGWLKSMYLGITITSYMILQIAYNLKLKKLVFLDIGAIATGFILRACAGAAASGIVLSSWFLLCTAMLALFLGIEKRKAELKSSRGGKTRAVLKKYSLPLLNRMESIVTTCTIMCYALWSSGPKLGGASTPWMLISLPFVIYGVFRYQLISEISNTPKSDDTLLTYTENSERPDEVLLRDTPIKITVISWVAVCFTIILLKSKGIIG
jgi:decaprenyl-phosphate phosphoribosyltransferase